jgi:site-specific DNA-methyltransferase (adenine-specific)
MPEPPQNINSPLFTNPLETFPGLSIDDLNKYLPAIRTVEDMVMTNDHMKEGLFLAKCLDGLKQIPDKTMDLIVANPPEDPWNSVEGTEQRMTLQEYYQWNNAWLSESYRVLKSTGAIYLFSPWQYSGMYHGLLSNIFKVQSRITWRERLKSKSEQTTTWENDTSDIWFATKTEDFLFNQRVVGMRSSEPAELKDEVRSNLWLDIPGIAEENGKIPQKLYRRILDASSFKLNWVLDPFMGTGDVGLASKQSGRRFIGFETNKDHLLLAMKRIEKHQS